MKDRENLRKRTELSKRITELESENLDLKLQQSQELHDKDLKHFEEKQELLSLHKFKYSSYSRLKILDSSSLKPEDLFKIYTERGAIECNFKTFNKHFTSDKYQEPIRILKPSRYIVALKSIIEENNIHYTQIRSHFVDKTGNLLTYQQFKRAYKRLSSSDLLLKSLGTNK
jgi:hypothetical protein